MKKIASFLSLALILAINTEALADKGPSIIGVWEGTVDLVSGDPSADCAGGAFTTASVSMNISEQQGNLFHGTMTVRSGTPDVYGSIRGRTLQAVTGDPGRMQLSGSLSQDGQSISLSIHTPAVVASNLELGHCWPFEALGSLAKIQ